MRSSLPLASLVVASLLAGCTSDGNLGGIDPHQQTQQAEQRASSLWERAAAAHVADVTIGGGTLDVSPGFAPLALAHVTIAPVSAGVLHLALRGAVHQGEAGWLVVDLAGPPLAIASLEGKGIELADYAVHAEGPQLAARLRGSTFPVFAPNAPPMPALANVTAAPMPSARFHGDVSVSGTNVRFYPTATRADAGPQPLGPDARVNATGAELVALESAGVRMFDAVVLAVLLERAPPTAWTGNVTVEAIAPTGTLDLSSGERLLSLYNSAAFTMRGAGNATLELRGSAWSLSAEDVELVDVRTGAGPHLETTIRLAPDLVEATGPAGNLTRVQLILAETSQGAHAHLLGYRIDPSVRARFVGHEPFAITNELLGILNDTEGPITPLFLFTLGVGIPFVALGEAFVAFATTLFPPSLAGPLSAGEARLLTFELVMPSTPQDVEILIEASNAEPARAIIRMQPAK